MVTALRWLGYAWVAYFAAVTFGAMGVLVYRWGAKLLRFAGLVSHASYDALHERTVRWTDIAFASRWNPFALPFWLVTAGLELLARAAIPDADDAANAHDRQPQGPSVWQLPRHIWQQLKHKVISANTMTFPLRLITGVAMGQLVATGLLLVVARVDTATVRIAPAGAHEVRMSVWVFWAVVVFLALAWSFVVSGAIVMRGRFRWLVLAVLAWTTHPPLTGDPFMTAWVVWLAVLAALMSDRHLRSSDDPASAPGFTFLAAVALWVFAYFGLAVWEVERATGLPFPEWFAGKMLSLTVFLIPLIFLAGAEMGEIGALIGSAAGSALERTWRGWGAFLASIAIAVATLWWVTPQILAENRGWLITLLSYSLTALALFVMMSLTTYTVFLAGPGGAKQMPADVPYGGLATAALGLAGAHVLVSVALSAWWLPPDAPLRVNYVVVQETTPAPFSISVPEGTAISSVDVPNSVGFVRGPLGNDAYVVVSRYPEDGPDRRKLANDRALIVHFWPYARDVSLMTENDRFAAYEYESRGLSDPTHCLVIVPKVTTGRWLVHACSISRHWERYYSRVLIPSLRSFRTDLSAQPEEPIEIAGLAQALARTTGFSLMPLLLGWVGLHLLGLGVGDEPDEPSPVSGQLRRAGLFMVTIGVLAVGFFPLRPFTTIGSVEGAAVSPLKDLLATTAAMSIAFSLFVVTAPYLLRRRLRMSPELLAANLGLLLLAWLYELYGRALTVQDISTLLAAGLLVVTLLWDLVMSGHPITNLSSPAFPRPARILLWAGYVTMVGTGILFYSSHTTGGPGAALSGMFETDETVRQGILWLGSAVLLSTLLTGLFGQIKTAFDEHERVEESI